MAAERRPWVKHRSLGRRHTDRKWPRHLRDFWMVSITGLVVLALANVRDTGRQVAANQRSTTRALCSFRSDLQKRADSGDQFLATHPNGIPGIPASTLRVSIANEKSTLRALKPLVC